MKFIPYYAACKHGRQEVHYTHPALEPILKDTFGNIVYQEQIIRIVADVAGFTAGEADLLRGAVGKKKEKALKRQKNRFIRGAVRNGIDKEAAEQIFKDIEYFANYGISRARMEIASPDANVMHPGPMNRGIEIESALADSPQSVIEQQVTNGVAVRMAVLERVSKSMATS